MDTMKKEINRYPDRSKDFLNFTILPWFNNRYAQVVKSGNQERIAKYESIDPLQLVIEYPRAVFRENGYFHATISARKSGLCFPDPKILFVPYERFLDHIDPQHTWYLHPDIPTDLSVDTLLELAKEQTTFPSDPVYYLTTLEDSPTTYALLILHDSNEIDLDGVFEVLFQGYRFQDISGYAYEPSDEQYPATAAPTLDACQVGEITLTETLVKEHVITFKLFTLKPLQNEPAPIEVRYDGQYRYDGKARYSGYTI